MTDSDNPLDELAPRRAKKCRDGIGADDLLKAIEALHGRYAYFTGQDRYYDTVTRTTVTKAAIDTAHRLGLGRGAAHTLLESDAVAIFEGPTWLPNGPRIIERGAGRYLNTYEPPIEQSIEGDTAPYLDLAEYLVPDAEVRAHLLDWMAFVIQNPAKKPNWHPLLGGIEGIGKDAFLYPLQRAVGAHNVVTIGPHDLDNQFNDQIAHKKLGILNEMLAFRDRRLENALKQYAAAPPDELQINPKGAARYTIPNILALAGMTNHRSKGMTLSQNDRRWMPYWSPAKPLAEDYYKELWQYLEGDGGLHVWHWLACRDLSGFNAKGRSPDTEYKRELVEVSEDPHLTKLREAIEEEAWPFAQDLVAMDQVLQFLDDPKMDAGRAGGLLRELDCKQHRGSRKIGRRTKTLRVWSVRRHEYFQTMRAADLFTEAERVTSRNPGPSGGFHA